MNPRHDTGHKRDGASRHVDESSAALPAHLVFAVDSSSAVAASAAGATAGAPISKSTQQHRRGELHGEVVGVKELYGRQSERLRGFEVKPRRTLPLGLDRLEQEV